MNVTRLLCVASLLVLPMVAAAQSVTTQPARERSATAQTREKDGSRTENTRQKAGADAPGKSENKGKKGEAPGQEKKSQSKDKKNKK